MTVMYESGDDVRMYNTIWMKPEKMKPILEEALRKCEAKIKANFKVKFYPYLGGGQKEHEDSVRRFLEAHLNKDDMIGMGKEVGMFLVDWSKSTGLSSDQRPDDFWDGVHAEWTQGRMVKYPLNPIRDGIIQMILIEVGSVMFP